MKLEGIAQKIARKMQEEGRVKTFNGNDLFDKDYYEKVKYFKENWRRELKEKGITVSFNPSNNYSSYLAD